MSFPAYGEYKDSGVEGLGDLPKGWTVPCLRRLICNADLGGNYEASESDEGIPLIKMGNLERGCVTTDKVECLPEDADYDHSFRLKCGDLLFNTRNSLNLVGKVAIWRNELPKAIYNSNILRIEFRNELVPDTAFMNYFFNSDLGLGQLRLLAKGTTSVAAIYYKDLTSLPVILPPPDEQKAISSFLDVETSKIDGLVSEQRRLIELLKEKRQAVISHAVTKGLNPNAPMKPSGIQWLGDVPQHWELERGRFLYRERDLPPEPDDGVVTSFRDGQVTLRTNRRTDGFTMAVLEVGYQRVLTGDLVIHGMDAFAGAIGVSESAGKCTPEYSVLVPGRDGMENQYFAKLLRLMALRNYIYVICPSVRQRAPRFRYSSFKDVWLPVPPHQEQVEIVKLIRNKSAELDALAAEAERAIELLQERRTALISAAVTGKIDVREFAYQETA